MVSAHRSTTIRQNLRSAVSLLQRGDLRPFARYLQFRLRRTDPYYRRIFRLRLRDWFTYHQSNVVYDRCTWMGVPALKNPLDAWIYQEILHEVRPEVVIELGSAAGGGTLYLAHLLDMLREGMVLSVDIDRTSFVAEHDRIVVVTGHTTAPETLQRVRSLCEGKRVLVIHDADHHEEQVLEDLLAYAPLVSVGSYLIVEDGIVDLFGPHESLGVLYGGPLPATQEFLRRNSGFQVDSERERYLLTYNPRGFLRRVAPDNS
ncbi:MAG TPA: CmcI family methyltransferase [Acidimicrobiales bacterium]|nr:CmcI family methyltransferase [Acidimicrobiales bacterium]